MAQECRIESLGAHAGVGTALLSLATVGGGGRVHAAWCTGCGGADEGSHRVGYQSAPGDSLGDCLGGIGLSDVSVRFLHLLRAPWLGHVHACMGWQGVGVCAGLQLRDTWGPGRAAGASGQARTSRRLASSREACSGSVPLLPAGCGNFQTSTELVRCKLCTVTLRR